MKERTLRIVLGIVGGLLILYVSVTLVMRSAGGGLEHELGPLIEALAAVETGDLEALRILAPGETFELQRGPDGWYVNGFEADSNAIIRFQRGLTEARGGYLVSTNPGYHNRMGLVAGAAWLIEVERGGNSLRLYIGEPGPSYPSSYVRLPGRDEAFLLHGDLGYATRRPLSEWRDRTVLALDTAAVHALQITRDGDTYRLRRSGDGWLLDNAEADGQVVREILGQLERFSAVAFAADTVEFGRPTRIVIAYDARNDVMAELSIAPGPGTSFLARGTASPYLFEVFPWRVDRVAPERAQVLGAPGR